MEKSFRIGIELLSPRTLRRIRRIAIVKLMCNRSVLKTESLAFAAESSGRSGMTNPGRVVTANLPFELVSELDRVANRIDRSKSWIVRKAVADWLTEEQRREETGSS